LEVIGEKSIGYRVEFQSKGLRSKKIDKGRSNIRGGELFSGR